MKTIEKINGVNVKIEWMFDEIIERHDSNWCEWVVRGTDESGNKYTGACQADGSSPENLFDKVTDVENDQEDYPALKSFKNNFNEMFP